MLRIARFCQQKLPDRRPDRSPDRRIATIRNGKTKPSLVFPAQARLGLPRGSSAGLLTCFWLPSVKRTLASVTAGQIT